MASARRGYQITLAFSLRWRRFLRPLLVDRAEDHWAALWRAVAAEFLGTAMLTFMGPGSALSLELLRKTASTDLAASDLHVLAAANAAWASSQLVARALASGFALAVLIYAFGELSGAHLNGALTWATLVSGRVSVLRFALYTLSQLAGAVAGAAVLRVATPPALHSVACSNLTTVSARRGVFIEAVCTFVFLFVAFATAVSPFSQKLAPLSGGEREYGPGKLTPLVVGLCLACLRLVGGALTGPSVNPSVPFGLAAAFSADVRGGCWRHQWVYWVGDLAGATAAATLSTALFLSSPTVTRSVLLISRGRDAFERLALPAEPTDYQIRLLAPEL